MCKTVEVIPTGMFLGKWQPNPTTLPSCLQVQIHFQTFRKQCSPGLQKFLGCPDAVHEQEPRARGTRSSDTRGPTDQTLRRLRGEREGLLSDKVLAALSGPRAKTVSVPFHTSPAHAPSMSCMSQAGREVHAQGPLA